MVLVSSVFAWTCPTYSVEGGFGAAWDDSAGYLDSVARVEIDALGLSR